MNTSWQERKINILDRWQNKCGLCNSSDSLRIHNRKGGKLKDADDNDLMPMCPDCYQLFNSPWKATGQWN